MHTIKIIEEQLWKSTHEADCTTLANMDGPPLKKSISLPTCLSTHQPEEGKSEEGDKHEIGLEVKLRTSKYDIEVMSPTC